MANSWDSLKVKEKEKFFDQAMKLSTRLGVLLDDEDYLVNTGIQWVDLTESCRKLLLDIVGDAVTEAALRDDVDGAEALFELEVGMAFDLYK